MNPNTNKFEAVASASDLTSALKKKYEESLRAMSAPYSGLVRSDGSPVPATWSVFTDGEIVAYGAGLQVTGW